jgi:signal transduction histidine kinase
MRIASWRDSGVRGCGVDSGLTSAVPTKSRILAIIARLLVAATLVAVTCTAVFAVLTGSSLGATPFLVSVAASTVVGGMIALRQPHNPVGWLFLVSALSFGALMFTHEYATYGLVTGAGSPRLAKALIWPQSWLWVPGAVSILSLLPLYFPDGRLVSPRWRPLARFALVFSAATAAFSAFRPGEIPGSGFPNPLGTQALRPFVGVLDIALLPVWLGLLFVSAASLLVRFRRSQGDERQQVKWLAFAASVIPVWFLVSPAVEASSPVLFELADGLVFAGIPVATAIAVFRYGLYEIDVIINRTLVNAALTACIVGVYVLLVGYLGQLLRTEGSLLISLVATGVVAVLFAPLRERLQRGVNRLMYGERDEPYAVVSRLGRRLEAAIAPDAVLPTIIETVKEALKLPYVAITLKRSAEIEGVAAQVGEPVGEPWHLPLLYRSEPVGELLLGPRIGSGNFSPADRRLLEDLARQAGVAAHAVRLTTDLQRSRERLVTMREEERRRLRRDLHDGLGAQLAGINVQFGVLRGLMKREPEAADALVLELRSELQAAISDIRRLAHDLRPPALDELGLVGALRRLAERYSVEGEGLRVQVEAMERLAPLPAAVEVAVYRIVQEALTNVVRHATAKACMVRLRVESEVTLEVVDDGVGFQRGSAGGVGVLSMRERTAEIGGECCIEPVPEGGTRLLARIPLPGRV